MTTSCKAYNLKIKIIFEQNIQLTFLGVGCPGRESNPGIRDGNPTRNLLDRPDSEFFFLMAFFLH